MSPRVTRSATEVAALARVLRLAGTEARRLRYQKIVGQECDRLAGWLEFETRQLVQEDLMGPAPESAELLQQAEKLQGPKR